MLVGDGVGVIVVDGVGVNVGVCVHVGDSVGLGVTVREFDSVKLPDAVSECVTVTVGVNDQLVVGLRVPVCVGDNVNDGVLVGMLVMVFDSVHVCVGVVDTEGLMEHDGDGEIVQDQLVVSEGVIVKVVECDAVCAIGGEINTRTTT